LIPSDDESARIAAFKVVERPHISKVETAIETWLHTGERPILTDMPLYFFALRQQVVGTLLISFESVSDILPPPKASDHPAIARRFLVDWWRAHGAMHAVGFTLSEL
jgi:hypothetical protein